MAARRIRENKGETRRRPATSPEQREQQLASMAYDVAEQQMRDGNASSQVITHFLRAGSGREELERVRIGYENELLVVKKEALAAQTRTEELFVEAMNAFRGYAGQPDPGAFEDET